MTQTRRPRGRPKGTGIDDRTILARIADIRAAAANVKPTTAIKTAGIVDPSAVRRLREKLKLVDAAAPPRPNHIPPLQPAAPAVERPATSARRPRRNQANTLIKQRTPKTTAAVTPAQAPPAEPPTNAAPSPLDPLTQWLHMGVTAAANVLQIQARVIAELVEWPAAGLLARRQEALAATLIAAVAEQRRRNSS